MELHLQLSDQDFASQFENCELDPEVFSHEAHLRLAWIHIRQYGVEQALVNIALQIQQYVRHVGAEDKYNHPLTIAAIRLVANFLERSNADYFPEFMEEFPELKSDFKNLVGKWM